MSDDVRIHLIGGDARLRSIAWELLKEGLVSHADRMDCGSVYLEGDKQKRKISHGHVALVLSTSQDKLDKVMLRARQLGAGGYLRAYALPVLQSFEQQG